MRIAVIIGFYARPDLLDLCLTSLSIQTRPPDQIIICDDASPVPPWESPVPYIRIKRIQRLERGYNKEGVYNRALVETDCDYILAGDQDCVFTPNWIALHEEHAKPAQAVCSQYTSLYPHENPLVTRESILDGSIWRTIPRAYEGEPMIWVGSGSAVWRKDALAINGFDSRLGWCGTDYNFGMRLARNGVTLVHSTTWTRYLHLFHEKPYTAGIDKWVHNKRAVDYANESVIAKDGIRELNRDDFTITRW